MSYLKNSSLAIIALLAAFVAFGLVAVILEMISWETLGDWTLKAVLVGLVFVALGAVLGMMGSMSKSQK